MYKTQPLKFLLYIFVTFIACIFYLLGTYYYELPDDNTSFSIVLINSLLFGVIASVLRISNNKFLGDELSVLYMEILYVCLLFFATILYSIFLTKDKIHTHTYIIFSAIVGLLITNHLLNKKI